MDTIAVLLAEGGGEIFELLVLFLIMVMSAIGSLIKNRSQSAKKNPKTVLVNRPRSHPSSKGKTRPEHPAKQPEFRLPSNDPSYSRTESAARESILPRIPLPIEQKSGHFERDRSPSHRPIDRSVPVASAAASTTETTEITDSMTSDTVSGLEKSKVFPGQDDQEYTVFLEHDELQKAIVRNEILGPPRALQDIPQSW